MSSVESSYSTSTVFSSTDLLTAISSNVPKSRLSCLSQASGTALKSTTATGVGAAWTVGATTAIGFAATSATGTGAGAATGAFGKLVAATLNPSASET